MKFGVIVFVFWVSSAFQLSAEQAEPHLANIKQLTFGGENAEAYFSFDGNQLIFQSTRDPMHCDHIFMMSLDGSNVTQVSSGKGRATCAYFFPKGKRVLYSSTHVSSPDCPSGPDYSKGYVWSVYPSYDIYTATLDGRDVQSLTNIPGYDAEATISPDGKKIVFTSDRDGDLELYVMDIDGSNVKRMTNSPGYDGGAFFSPDSKQIVFRADVITDEKDLEEYRSLLKEHLVKPGRLEIFVMNADGTNRRQITHNGKANFCPYFHPNGRRIIFASNMDDPGQRNFDLYLIDVEGKNLERVTYDPTFDGFPMFSPDGKKLVFASNRNGKVRGETNIFIADWVENPAPSGKEEIALLKKDLTYLASDDMKGRLTGTPEARRAAEYITAQFRSAGLRPAPGMDGFFQQFEFTSGVKLGSTNTLTLDQGKPAYSINKDFIPMGFSGDAGLHSVPVVFAGFGIQAVDQNYDDYADLDVKDKAVVIYRWGPEGDDPKSVYATYYPVRYKAMTAREHGAGALFVVSEDPSEDELITLRNDASFGTSGIPVLSTKRSVIADWLKVAGHEFPDPKDPHGTLRFELKGISISLECNLIREKSKSDNVLGWLAASEPTDRTIVLGAHYDHLGLGIEGSLAQKWGEVHNGADDNASGTTALIELARKAAAENSRKDNLLFIAFGGEELGVLGSSYFVKNPVVSLKNIVAMLNMDMVGRLRDSKLVVGGVGTSPAWPDLLKQANTGGLQLTLNQDGYGPSDHAPFYMKDIPVLFFFTGSHAEYHKPEDDAALINFQGLDEVMNYVWGITETISNSEPPQFTRVKGTSQEMAGRGFRVYLGTIPDYTEEVKGVKLSGVREGSPAEKAGLKGGDIIVEFGGKKIENIYDYTYALQEHKAGETVAIVVQRDGDPVSLQVILEKRAAQ